MSRGNDARPEEVASMFDRIAGVYDRTNLLISWLQEPRWRRRVVREARIAPSGRILDVACGTGTLTLDLLRAAQPGGRVVGVDASAGMLARARQRAPEGTELVPGDALDLPVEDDSFDVAVIAFGMRNLADHERGFREMARATRPGGRVVCLEIARPTGLLGRLGDIWLDRAVPLLGRLVGHADAYAYLVRSTRAYPPPDEVAAMMRSAGLCDVTWTGLSAGLVTIHTGVVSSLGVGS